MLSEDREGAIAGVCVVRDAADIVPFLCGHYLRVGFSHIRFVDDGSSDGTFEFLSELSRCTKAVSVTQVRRDTFRQARLMTDAANELLDAGYRTIVPFDADEFWNVTARDVHGICSGQSDVAFIGRWQNFVQQRDVTSPHPFRLLQIRYRAPALADANPRTIAAFERPFVCFLQRKVAFKTGSRIRLVRGQHGLIGGPPYRSDPQLEIFHVPLRCRSEISKRALNYEPRRAPLRKSSRQSWQSAFHEQVVRGGRIDEVWAANSAGRNGTLEVGGEQVPLVPDTRLRSLLVQAWSFSMLRWPDLYASTLRQTAATADFDRWTVDAAFSEPEASEQVGLGDPLSACEPELGRHCELRVDA